MNIFILSTYSTSPTGYVISCYISPLLPDKAKGFSYIYFESYQKGVSVINVTLSLEDLVSQNNPNIQLELTACKFSW